MISPGECMHLVGMSKGRKTVIPYALTENAFHVQWMRFILQDWNIWIVFSVSVQFFFHGAAFNPSPKCSSDLRISSAHEFLLSTLLAWSNWMLMCQCSEVAVVFRAASQCGGFVERISEYVRSPCVLLLEPISVFFYLYHTAALTVCNMSIYPQVSSYQCCAYRWCLWMLLRLF